MCLVCQILLFGTRQMGKAANTRQLTCTQKREKKQILYTHRALRKHKKITCITLWLKNAHSYKIQNHTHRDRQTKEWQVLYAIVPCDGNPFWTTHQPECPLQKQYG